jgi:hypothetical protein
MENEITTRGLIFAIVFVLSIAIISHAINVEKSLGQSTNPTLGNKTIHNNLTNESGLMKSITIPVEKGYVNGKISYFISTDASEKNVVSSVSNTTGYSVNYAPSLNHTSESSRQQGYVFMNGVSGNNTSEQQLPVASATVGDEGYSPLFEINYVKWNNESESRVLKSVSEIMESQANGEISITKSNIIINSPAVDIQ